MRLSNATPPCPVVLYNISLVPLYIIDTLELWETESEACHTALVLFDCRGAIFLGFFGVAKEHTFVSRSFLLFAYTAWLDFHASFALGLKVLAHVCTGGGRH